ncbi:glutamyl-tRNA reductase [Kibdelosporangium philippinense]|uniref:Glutamyl-tRNA reductase n=1 Tax=Kibdelosporangium philippinense TaxID=211113 RepID=A0ABS8ZID1_9PSEU|nr:glutamyl-tRNA reductase [Kibdelosporangium philippinense]MCE7005592.1 glutamyl-tRNA reductase [Kibdelosporangium philippinense]
MSVLAVGVSHRTADVDLLERVAVPADKTDKVLADLLQCVNVSEAILVSTCNRVEIYAVVDAFHGGLSDVVDVLSRHSGQPTASLYRHLYVHYAGAAVEHLFTVTAGLDSMVVGEAQILGQVRTAYNTAREHGTVGRVLHELTQKALRVGKRAHSETDLDQAGGSVVSEALLDAETTLNGLAGRKALVVGAGSMGGLAVAALKRAEIGQVVIANRSQANGSRLANTLVEDGIPATAVGLEDLEQRIAEADVVVSCTGAVTAVIRQAHILKRDKPLVVCDLGLPRDVEHGVADIDNVTVVDLESLQRRLADAPSGQGAARAASIVAEEVQAYLAAQRSAEVTPTVTALRRRAAEVVDSELLRLDSKLPDLDGAVRDELARTVRRVVDKLLHTPTVRVKQLAANPAGAGYADALRELFALDPAKPDAITKSRVDGEL